jgi:hypothetical protein
MRVASDDVVLLWLSPSHCYWHPRLEAVQIVRRWPGPLAAGMSKQRGAVADEKRLQGWLTDQMRMAPDVPRGKARVSEEAQAAGFTFSARGFDRAWQAAKRDANAPAWGAAGRRKSKQQIEAQD